ncbi:fibronectin type III domain-containing protein [Modestobacter sp. VKM Ac-2985]|uniref:fibronectin type III domain-containing protein n=1 Tax=Modestobacter sp. VKM Ac-2985 TaxID=3004139 RepID=UPI0022AB5DAC|nr:fibronectin type III domain-containing protein [Modestobacter sp. VKM Ac-2985]MCZ2836028.1 fibronectin type III domain-containing protein [Modestobacter sp. VKM Ac-2985]
MTHAVPQVPRARQRTAAVLLALLMAGLATVQVLGAPGARAADPTPQMYQGPAFPTAASSPTEDKPQSKLWFADGSWWALMRTAANGTDGNPDITVHRLQPDHTWANTGTVVDRRAASTGDALWDGGKLYVSSRVPNGNIEVARLSYATATDSWTMDSGFPKAVTSGPIESVSIARDSLQRLWVTFTRPHPTNSSLDQVWVAHSTTSDTAWTAPFLVPVSDNTVKADDISAIVAFGGKIGVMWSDQQNSVIRFAVHPDTAGDQTGWTLETAVTGPRSADDHINLKSLMEDDQGQVYAAIKTSRGDSSTDSPSDPSVGVLVRSSSGSWTNGVAATVAEGLTRPQLALDTTNRRVYVVMSTEGGGSVYYKTAPMGANPSFSPSSGRGLTMLSWSGAQINNASLAKAPISAGSGLVVLASDDEVTKRYYHAELSLGGGTSTPPADTTAPTVPGGVAATANAPTQVTVTWGASTDAVGVASYRVTRDGAVVAGAVTGGTSFVDQTASAATTHRYTVSAVDAAGNRSAESAAASVTTPATGPAPEPEPEPGAGISVGASSQGVGSTASTTVTIPKPAGVATGDVLIAQITADGVPNMSAAPAGWTAVVAPLSVSTGARVFAYSRVVGDAAAEPASYVWQLSASKKWNGAMTAFSGVDPAQPFETVASTRVNSSSSTVLTVPGLTTTTPGAVLVGGAGPNSGAVGVAQPSGWTESVESRGAQVAELAWQARPTAGATGDVAWRMSYSIQSAGWLRALRPAA